MGQVFAFHGGVHPPENKAQSTGVPIQQGPVPKKVRLPVQQHIGAPAEPVVSVGQKVMRGQLIAEPVGRVSCAIHASISGVVTSIGPMPIAHSSGLDSVCIEIEADDEQRSITFQGLDDYKSVKKAELIDYIRNKGIAGMGGAGFPTDVKLHLGDDHIVNTLIINAAECEPYITADDMLMRERADQVLGGIEVIAHLLQPSHILIGIEDNKPHAIRALQQACEQQNLNIDVVVVPTKYPSGGEKQLIKLLTGVEVPSGRIPADVGIVCQNVGTTTAIYKAVKHGEPLISRVVTLTGDALACPQNVDVAIGTHFKDLLDHAALKEGHLNRLVVGGPMMGFTVSDDQLPVTKATNCLIAATSEEMPSASPAQPCIRCGQCEQVCPAELLPQQLHWFAKGREFDKAQHHNLFDCIECGACSFVCPSEIPLVQYYRFAKAEIRAEQADARKAEHAKQRFEARQARLEAEKAEKEARRKQRAEEAARAQAVKKDKQDAPPAKEAAAAGADVKALKTAAAVARTKLKKAEKAVAQAEQGGADNLDQLKEQLKAAEHKSVEAQRALELAESGGGTAAAAAGPDLKQLKTNAAVARTKLKKAEKALQNASDKGLDGIDALQQTVDQLREKSDQAEKAYEQAQQAPAAPAPVVDLKQLKTNAAVARTKLKQAEKALQKAEAAGGDLSELQQKVAALTEKAQQAQQAYDAAESGGDQSAAGPSTADLAKLEELQADIDALQAKIDKGQVALDKAIESGSPAADKMKAGVDKLRDKLRALHTEHQQLKSSSAGSAAPAMSEEQQNALKEEIEALQGKIDKGQLALDKAIESGSPAVEKMKAGVNKLRDKLKGLQDELNQGVGSATPKVSAEKLAELKEEIDQLQAKVDKGQSALDKAIESGSPAAEKMKAGVEKLRDKLKALQDELRQAEGGSAGSEAVTGATPEQIASLKEDVDQLQAKVDKGQAALDKAIESGSPAAEKMKAGVEKLRQKLIEAEQAYAEVVPNTNGQEVAVAEKPDMKELKQNVSIMRTKLRKLERQLEDEGSEDPALQQEIDLLTERYTSAKNAFEKAEEQLIADAAAQGIDLNQLKIDAAMARAAVTKAKKALERADAEGDLSELTQTLQQAETNAEQLTATLSRFE